MMSLENILQMGQDVIKSSQLLEIVSRKLQREEAVGGFTSLVVGPPGSGKTSLLLTEAEEFMSSYPNEIIIWRDSPLSAAQFNRVKKFNWEIFVENKCKIRFRNLTKGGPMNIKFTYFKNFDDLIDCDSGKGLLKPQQLNVVYFKNEYTWIDLLFHLRNTVGWQSVFIDEIEDIIPLNPSKRPGEEKNYRHEKNLEFSNNVKQLRKGLVNLLGDTQAEDELDWRFKRKLNFTVYLRGARVSSNSRILQHAINKLRLGECWIDMENRIYGMSTYNSYPPKRPVFEVILE